MGLKSVSENCCCIGGTFITPVLWKIQLSQLGVTHFSTLYLGHKDINIHNTYANFNLRLLLP